MTLMLASVTGPQEAEIAVDHGADIVDVKDVGAGFGRVDAALVRATAEAVAGRRPVSAVTGAPDMNPALLTGEVAGIAAAGATFVKIALFAEPPRASCIEALSSLADRARLVGVMFADQGAEESLIATMARCGFAGVMIDTLRKSAGRLFDHMDIAAIGRFVDVARGNGLMAGLAGSLEVPDIPRLLLSAPDVLGFRRALCSGADRSSSLDARAVDVVRALIPQDSRRIDAAVAPLPKIDYRLLAARGYSLDTPKQDGETDRIFVREFVLPIRIGAYAHEREKPQKVRFDVEVNVTRLDRTAQDIRDVFSYDLITDAIRMIVAQEHIPLVEMLAERIAAVMLTHRRVTSVRVRVEKLEIGPGGIGVEIVRHWPQEVAKAHHLYPSASAESDPKVVT
jgi:dihydroneopterin aldolase